MLDKAKRFVQKVAGRLTEKPSLAFDEFVVVVTDARGSISPSSEKVKATTPEQAAERAANHVAMVRLKSTNERSWRFKCLVGNAQFNVVVQAMLKAEVC